MILLRVYRPVLFDNFKVNVTRAFCSKASGDGDRPSGESSPDKLTESTDNQNQEKKATDDVTDRINQILKSMIAQKEEAKTAKTKVGEYNFQPKKKQVILNAQQQSEKAIMDAAASVAKTLGNDPEIEEKLVSRALGREPPPIVNVNWSDMIEGMQVDKTVSEENVQVNTTSRSQEVHSATSQRWRESRGPMAFRNTVSSKRSTLQHVDLLGGKPLGIFSTGQSESTETELKMWNVLEDYEKRILTSQSPKNYYEKMIQWTNQDKIWKFPIDNEQGMDEEKNIHFTEHIFLEHHLDGWCPEEGPIRHFMELVCIGLSKNPYMPSRDKQEHIIWYKDYFESKKELLKQVGALGDEKSSEKPIDAI